MKQDKIKKMRLQLETLKPAKADGLMKKNCIGCLFMIR